MWNLNYSSVSEIASVLSNHGLAMTKKFGQNFLISPEARERIVSLIRPRKGMNVWEIGPGLGAITHLILQQGAHVTAFEIDHGFAEILREEAFTDEPGFTLVEGDALKTLKAEGKCPDLIVGNLPYNVGSVMIGDIIERGMLSRKMVFTLQKEVVERICASPSSKDYSSFSVLCQLDYVPSYAFTISRSSFYPQPNVDSAVVVMTKKEENLLESEERSNFFMLLRSLFSQRRKTIKNNLSRIIADKTELVAILERAGIDEKERAENLSLEDILRLYRSI